MYVTTAAETGRGTAAVTVWLEETRTQHFPAGAHRVDDEFSARHHTDLAAGFGLTYRDDLPRSGTTFAAMAAGLVTERDEVQLAVVTHKTPDLDCRYAAGTYLSDLPGAPLSFALSGPGAPFSGILVAGRYQQRHGLDRAAVLAFDQDVLPYDVPVAQAVAGAAGCALLLGRSDGPGRPLTVAQRGGRDLDGAIEDIGKTVGPLWSGLTVLHGATVPAAVAAEYAGGGRVTALVDEGRPATAVLERLTAEAAALYVGIDAVSGEAVACLLGSEL